MRRRVTRRPSPPRIAARTCAGYAVRTGTPCTPVRSYRRNNGCSRRTGTIATRWRCAPGRVTFSGRRSARVVPRVKVTQIVLEGAHASPHAEAGIAVTNPIVVIDQNTAMRRQGTPAKEEEEGTKTVLGYLNRYRTPSCTCKIGQGIRTIYPRGITRENRFSLSLRSCDDRSSQPKVKKYPSTSLMTHALRGEIVPTHAAKDPKKAWLPIARRLAPIARVVRKKGKDGYVHTAA